MTPSASRSDWLGPHGDGREDHAALGALHALDLARLVGGRQVLVEDADAALARHGDGGARLGDRVHRGADERDVELDVRGRAAS